MSAIGIALIWGGYAVSLWGYCLVRGYNVGFTALVNPVHPYSGAWPPAPIPSGQLLPGAAKAAAPAATAT